MSKQDRQGVRTFSGLEQKYNFGSVFSRLDAENKEQNLTIREFAELVAETISTIQKDIKTLGEKDTQLDQVDASLGKDIDSLGDDLNSLDTKLSNYWKTIYPVGSVYISVSTTSPATLFGGEWERLKDRFLLGAGDTYSNGQTGGEAEHTLSIEEIPSHRHKANGQRATSSTNGPVVMRSATLSNAYTENEMFTDYEGGQSDGTTKAHNNMPPYLAVYMWKRTK